MALPRIFPFIGAVVAIAAVVLTVIGVSTDYWFSTSVFHSGLWRKCLAHTACSETKEASRSAAMAISALIAMAIAGLLAIVSGILYNKTDGSNNVARLCGSLRLREITTEEETVEVTKTNSVEIIIAAVSTGATLLGVLGTIVYNFAKKCCKSKGSDKRKRASSDSGATSTSAVGRVKSFQQNIQKQQQKLFQPSDEFSMSIKRKLSNFEYVDPSWWQTTKRIKNSIENRNIYVIPSSNPTRNFVSAASSRPNFYSVRIDTVDRTNIDPKLLPYLIVEKSSKDGTGVFRLACQYGKLVSLFSVQDLVDLKSSCPQELRQTDVNALGNVTFIEACKLYAQVVQHAIVKVNAL
ncbi:unnamed protein product [Didymodactylos carnosus]|uniref:Uncharacterized protein n=1 Tax=Didymodactylos carnosus TaxID=1234261 RepID=A0A814NI93_9BILA|nr:unnamed protein product [Didymodactylos carnosus]CAF1091924.1 unnamed protein product [Didymodactylos carnosus]CAF3667533.1 unnamed protein product [Didymodactylos carnosus]CAF3857404.1 unnamed protein product [Didymodactylos carnosus]